MVRLRGLSAVFSVVLILFSCVAVHGWGRLYAGYKFRDMPWYCPGGSLADIKTINPWIWNEQNFLTQWVTIIFSYGAEYWVQVGYCKDHFGGLFHERKYYMEVTDRYGAYRKEYWEPGPSPGSWHEYRLVRNPSDPDEYNFYLDGGLRNSWEPISPNEPIDQWVESETTHGSINIDGTQFKDICFSYDAQNWYWWYEHHVVESDPYWVLEITHHEFKAYKD